MKSMAENKENKLDLGFAPVKLARESLEDNFYNQGIAEGKPEGLDFRAGAFVSIKQKMMIR